MKSPSDEAARAATRARMQQQLAEARRRAQVLTALAAPTPAQAHRALQAMAELQAELDLQMQALHDENEELAVLASRQATMLDLLPAGSLMLDRQGVIGQANPAAAAALGGAREALLGTRLHERVSPAQWVVLDGGLRGAFASGVRQTCELEVDTSQGRRTLRLDLLRSADGQWCLAALQDVSERRQHEQELRLLEASLQHVHDIVLVTEATPLAEPGPRIVYVNPAFERLTGYSRAEVQGRSPRFLQGPLTQRDALDRISAALAANRPVREVLVNYTRAGRPFWVDMDIAPVVNAAGRTTHLVAIERDVTDRLGTPGTPGAIAAPAA